MAIMTPIFDRTTTVRFALQPLEAFLKRKDITEICVNRPGEVFFETSDGWDSAEVPDLTYERLMDLGKATAVLAELPFGDADPILSATLPDGERAQFVQPPAVEPGLVSLTIRKPSRDVRALQDYTQSGFFSLVSRNRCSDPVTERLLSLQKLFRSPIEEEAEEAILNFFRLAVRSKKSIVIAGETGSGKTTFMKALMQEIPVEERILTIEDVPELAVGLPKHKNRVSLFYPAEGESSLNAATLIRSALRMKPDRILLAELRGAEAFDFLTASLTGHGGSITSCHAGSCAEAFEYLALRVMQSEAGSQLPYREIRRLLHLAVDIVVHIHASNGIRQATEIWYDPESKTLAKDLAAA